MYSEWLAATMPPGRRAPRRSGGRAPRLFRPSAPPPRRTSIAGRRPRGTRRRAGGRRPSRTPRARWAGDRGRPAADGCRSTLGSAHRARRDRERGEIGIGQPLHALPDQPRRGDPCRFVDHVRNARVVVAADAMWSPALPQRGGRFVVRKAAVLVHAALAAASSWNSGRSWLSNVWPAFSTFNWKLGPAGDRRADRVDRLAGDPRVGVAEVEQRRTVHLVDQAEHPRHARAVVADAHARLGVAAATPKASVPPRQKPSTPGAAVIPGIAARASSAAMQSCCGERRVELAGLGDRVLHAGVVVGRLEAGGEAPEQLGRADEVAEAGEALADGADVRARRRRSPGSARSPPAAHRRASTGSGHLAAVAGTVVVVIVVTG